MIGRFASSGSEPARIDLEHFCHKRAEIDHLFFELSGFHAEDRFIEEKLYVFLQMCAAGGAKRYT